MDLKDIMPYQRIVATRQAQEQLLDFKVQGKIVLFNEEKD